MATPDGAAGGDGRERERRVGVRRHVESELDEAVRGDAAKAQPAGLKPGPAVLTPAELVNVYEGWELLSDRPSTALT